MCSADCFRRFESELEGSKLLAGIERILVGCSGGSDSTALALLLDELLFPGSGCALWIGHVNHGLRGEESDADEDFVRALARELGRPFVVERGDVEALSSRAGESVEAAARAFRYGAFTSWASSLELDAVALAHTREDQQETVLLRLLRGSGVRGLAAMPASRPLAGRELHARVVRPLLGFGREELRAFLEASGRSYREDSSNVLLDRPRNVLRHEILPRLEAGVAPGARAALERTARLLRETLQDLERLATRALDEARDPNGGGYRASALRELPRSILREVLVLLLREREPFCPAPSETAFTRFAALLQGVAGHRADLGRGAVADLRYGRLRIIDAIDTATTETPREVALDIGGAPTSWGEWVLEATRGELAAPRNGAGLRRDEVEVSRVADRDCSARWMVRARRPGDRYRPRGAPGRKKLKELFREARVPPHERLRWPLVCRGSDIAWVVGQRVGEAFAPIGADPVITIFAWRSDVSAPS